MKTTFTWAVCALFMLCVPAMEKMEAQKGPGTYDVGFKLVQLKDSSRTFKLTSGETSARPITLFVWYPAKKTAQSRALKYTDYLFLGQDVKEKGKLTGAEKEKILKDFVLEDMAKAAEGETGKRMRVLKNLETRAYLNAGAVEGKFPLLLFGPGGTTSGYFYSGQCEYLASQGYVTAALPSLPVNEGERWPFAQTGLELHIEDMEVALEYAGKLDNVDAKHTALIAFSVGGVSQALLQMKHVSASAFVSLDGGTGYKYGYNMLKQSKHYKPAKMNIPYFHAHGLKEARYIVEKDFTLFNKLKTADKYLLTFDDLSHAEFTSLYQVKHKIAGTEGNQKAFEQYALLNEAVLNFLNCYLKKDAASGEKLKAMAGHARGCLALQHGQNPNATRERLAKDFMKNNGQAAAALKAKDYEAYKKWSHRLVQYTPNHPVYMYQYAKALALAGDVEDALSWLEEVFKLGGSLLTGADKDKDFEGLLEHPKFKELVQRANKEFKPLDNSKVAFTIGERDLMSEGVAYDSRAKVLYVSSLYKRKIVAVTADGKVSDFVKEKQDGLLGTAGMEVDEQRRHLWACSGWSGRNDISGIKRGDPPRTPGIYKYHLETGKLVKKYMQEGAGPHFFNDLTVSSAGDAFITDTVSGEVYTVHHKRDKLELFSSGYAYPNGITISDDGRDLFIAHYTGISKIDLRTGATILVSAGAGNTLVFADGLAYYKNSLIAHQVSCIGGIYQYFLDDSREEVKSKKALELYNPLFDFPTTGEIGGDTYYYLANAQFRNYNRDGAIFPFEKLSDVIILELPLQ